MSKSLITLGAINMDAHDPVALSSFWAALTGGAPDVNGSTAYLAPSGPEGFGMFFQPREGNRPSQQDSHLDLTVPWGSRQSEVERVLALGATFKWDVLEEFDHVQWTTLADPEGNLFCIAEHPPH
ncbi:glyoxalase/bleomycin resistance/dioxygenase family protein [Arthrobacter psychrolactophilus]|uniref:Glyoxalase/bleomycin resistance/dioxygenase family protein n=1 Tax=Arthrobacter psychrolactophilus TaxID=92442 RepID=A0A2V5IQ47_9MICC|nr:VOC family protein [Arthrobacter psychrolactophilus]PYI37522.1 glyoxalase/bleomycin resistance/dioxygenase family protein [Arthrobacter psychrolactophilus]